MQDVKASCRFVIADNGTGMSEEFQAHLFEPFSQEKSAAVSEIEGTGLGLPIVKKIIDMADGTISVESELGKDSVFTVDIPFAVMDEQAIAEYPKNKTAREAPIDITELFDVLSKLL